MAGRNRCSVVLTRGEYKGKKCNQGAGHDVQTEQNPTPTPHKYTPPKVRPALNLTAIGANITKVTDTRVMAEHRRVRDTSPDRSKERQFIDQIVQAAYDAWVESGKPSEWSRSYGLQLQVPSDQVDTFKDRVHTSARSLAYKAGFGDDKTAPDGSVTITLRVVDLPSATNDSTPDASANEQMQQPQTETVGA